MAGNSAIWQVQTSAVDGAEATAGAGNTIQFNEAPLQTSPQTIFGSDFDIRLSIPENTRVFSDGNDIQEMGMAGVEIQLVGMFKDVSDTTPNNTMDKFMTWMRQDKRTTGYLRGRFGLRLDDFPHFNIVPTATFGGLIQNPHFRRDPDNLNNAFLEFTMRVGGDHTAWLLSNGF